MTDVLVTPWAGAIASAPGGVSRTELPGGLRVVGPRWSVRSHDLRDILMRVGIPYWFYDEDSETGGQPT